jgi:hypothetical protein
MPIAFILLINRLNGGRWAATVPRYVVRTLRLNGYFRSMELNLAVPVRIIQASSLFHS